MKFVNLHGHSSFSYGDGHKLPKDHVQRVKELGMDALALTEHGNTSSHVQFEIAATKEGIKPIYGVEAYVAPQGEKRKFHQTILAMDEEGYRQLNRLVTRSWGEGFYYEATVDPEWLLDKEQTSHLILLSGCADSWLSCAIAGGKSLGERLDEEESELFLRDEEALSEHLQEAINLVERFQEVYGDRYYLEIQPFDNYYRTCFINKCIEHIAAETGIPVVATADVHYPHPDDWEVQRLSNAIKWGKSVEELAEGRDYESGQTTYPLSDKALYERLRRTGVSAATAKASILNTRKVAERCNVTLPKTTPVRYSGSDGTDEGAKRLLKRRIMEGVKFRKETSEVFAEDFSSRENEYKARIKKELDVILPKGFSDYFLINEQVISWAKSQGIAVGPGRGSAASSLICYLLRITEVNPMKFPQMVFERFLDPSREDDPDIDTDYQDDRRNEVFEYMRGIYGEENVGNIGNFSRFRGKTAVKTAGKALRVPYPDTESLAGYIETPAYGDPREFNSAEDAVAAFPEAHAIVGKYPDLKLAYGLEGDMRGLGVHAAGMVISNNPISETCSIYKRKKSNGDSTEVIAYDKRDAAYLKMLKLDCLGLLTMTIIADTIELVNSESLTLEQLYNLPLDDEKVLKGFADDDLTGIFQFEGRSTRGIVKDIFLGKDRIPNFMHLADINALSRPGSLSSGMTRQYISVENGEARKSIHPVVDEVLGETNGCLVYQEQVMRIGKEFGGLADSEVGRLRKIIGAKQAGGAFDEFWAKFRDGANQLHGVPEGKAKEVWDYMAASASYLFNVSHAISYALVAYWCMYLKVYYPAEFFASSLRSAAKKGKVKGQADPQQLILRDAAAHGLTINAPNPKTSEVTWQPNKERTGIEAGFTQIPGIGEKTARRMVEDRTEKTSESDPVLWQFFVDNTPMFGVKSKERAEMIQGSSDPFEIYLTNDAINSVVEAISEDIIPLSFPNATSATIGEQEGKFVTYVGHVVAVKIIDHLAEVRQRENLTHEEVTAKLRSPELAIKAKIICADPGGTEVHVNVSRFLYPALAEEIGTIKDDGIFVIHAEGVANAGFGPAVQAESLDVITLNQ